jgi:hypothetical protein
MRFCINRWSHAGSDLARLGAAGGGENAKLIQPTPRACVADGVLETPSKRGIRAKWLNVQGVAATLSVSFTGCVGLAICATTIKDVLLRL